MSDTTPGTTGDVLIHARVYPAGRLDISASGPAEHRDIVKHALTRAARIDSWISASVFGEVLHAGGLSDDLVTAICATVKIVEDEAYYVSDGQRR